MIFKAFGISFFGHSVIHSAIMPSRFTPVCFCISEVGLQVSDKRFVLCKVLYCHWIKDFASWVCNPNRWTRRGGRKWMVSEASAQQVRAGKQIKIHDWIQPSTLYQYRHQYSWCKPFLVSKEHLQTLIKIYHSFFFKRVILWCKYKLTILRYVHTYSWIRFIVKVMDKLNFGYKMELV